MYEYFLHIHFSSKIYPPKKEVEVGIGKRGQGIGEKEKTVKHEWQRKSMKSLGVCIFADGFLAINHQSVL